MAENLGEVNPLLRRPLYVFDLPPDLLNSLKPVTTSAATETVIREPTPPPAPTSEDGVSQSTSCNLCKATFPTVQDQRQHVKSDFHRYNLKLKLRQLPLLDEATFIQTIGDIDESISGSESSDSEEEEEDGNIANKDTTLSALLKRQAKLSQENGEVQKAGPIKTAAGNAPIVWLSTPKIGDNDLLGVYRAILSKEEQETASLSLVDTLRKKQLTPIQAKHSGSLSKNGTVSSNSRDAHYFLCMIGGGHFAAMIVSLIPEIRRGQGGVEERHAIVRAHKTFHRYTTRRKQGGSQSANDNAKGKARSVGASIRRANEVTLELDVRNILSEWKTMIETAELLFVRATGTTNRRTLFGPYEGQVLRGNDPRLRGFPFSTRRATQAELLRSFQELTRLKVSKLVKAGPEPSKSETPVQKPAKPRSSVPKLNKDEESAQLHTSQLQALIRRSKAPGVLLYLTKNDLSSNFKFFPPNENHHAPTPLHLSASTNSPALVSALLLKTQADPTVQNSQGKTAYEIAGDSKTRDAFRLARHQLGESVFDWTNAAHVASALSQEDIDAKQQAEKSAVEAQEAERRKTDLEQLSKDEEARTIGRIERKAGAGKSLATTTPAVEKTGAEQREEESRGLTPEMKMRLERERRARAAEERIKRMQQGAN